MGSTYQPRAKGLGNQQPPPSPSVLGSVRVTEQEVGTDPHPEGDATNPALPGEGKQDGSSRSDPPVVLSDDVPVARPHDKAPKGRTGESGQVPHGEAELRPTQARVLRVARGQAAPAHSDRLLDAWHATYSGVSAISQLSSSPRLTEASIEAVLASGDDRLKVTETRIPPWRWLCQLVITAADGSQWLGTGWLASPRLVVTAGHCVYMPQRGGWADAVDVFPERNGTFTPYRFTATDLRTVTGWVTGARPEADYGAVILPSATQGLGNFGYAALEDDDLDDMIVNVFGYPSDKDPATLWGHDRQIKRVRPRTLVYDVSTFGGQSGGPVFYLQGGRRYVVGIHNYGDVTGNMATRITPEVFDNIQKWRLEADAVQ